MYNLTQCVHHNTFVFNKKRLWSGCNVRGTQKKTLVFIIAYCQKFPSFKLQLNSQTFCIPGSRSPPGLPTGPQDPLSAFEMTRLALLKVFLFLKIYFSS